MPVSLILDAKLHDLGGGFVVRRLLPAADKQGVGPFVFFDHFGPVTEKPQDHHDVRPHPHIGLSTVTYLFQGAMMHRDNLGSSQRIEPGAINWMTAGRGIVHSERKPEDLREQTYPVHGLQLWAALPLVHEEVAPSFSHTPADAIPEMLLQGGTVRVLVGSAFGVMSPVKTLHPTLYLDVEVAAGKTLELEASPFERAVYVISGRLSIDGRTVAPTSMALLEPGLAASLEALEPARYVVIGGEALEGHRHIWWNFVSSSRERIEQAKQEWLAQSAPKIPGETEFIPLPVR
jgi:redox-sensitive bicupin YhaK (pirin superfamily)